MTTLCPTSPFMTTLELALIEAIKSLAIDTGVVSSTVQQGGNTLQDLSKGWAVNIHVGKRIKIVKGVGAGQQATIQANSMNTIVIRTSWPMAIVSGAEYVILDVGSADSPGTTIPTAKASLPVGALPAAEASWLSSDIIPTNSPSYLRIYVCVSVGGVFRVARTRGGAVGVENMNSSVALIANAAYIFTVSWLLGDSINFRYSVTGGNITSFQVNEHGV